MTHPTEFFGLGDQLTEELNIRLGKRKRYRKWGILGLLLKHKHLKRLRSHNVIAMSYSVANLMMSLMMTSYVLQMMKKMNYYGGLT